MSQQQRSKLNVGASHRVVHPKYFRPDVRYSARTHDLTKKNVSRHAFTVKSDVMQTSGNRKREGTKRGNPVHVRDKDDSVKLS